MSLVKFTDEELGIILTYLKHGKLVTFNQYGFDKEERIKRSEVKDRIVKRLQEMGYSGRD